MFALDAELVRSCAQRLAAGRDREAVAATLLAAGAIPDAHVELITLGAVMLTKKQRLEWYAGRLVACIREQQWAALERALRGCETCTGLALSGQ